MAYIDRNIALQIIDNYAKTVTEDSKVIVDAVRDIVSIITPTADVVKVVRCKDCIHFEAITLDSGISVGFGNCKNKNGINLYPKETDFCSYGERSDT